MILVLIFAGLACGWAPRSFVGRYGTRRTNSEKDADEQPVVDVSEEVEAPREDFRTYLFGAPGELERDLRLLGTSRERVLTYWAAGAGIGLAGDLLGVTSGLLTSSPEGVKRAARRARIDAYYPIDGRKRYIDDEYGFEFLYPKTWLGDQAVYLSRASERSGAPEALVARQRRGVAAVAAFGPPRGTFEENVSVFRSSTEPGFSLRGTLGEPADAATRLLDAAIAPPSSGKVAALIDAFETPESTYVFEYTLQLPKSTKVLHNLAVVAQRGGTELLTMTVLCRASDWPDREPLFRDMARSFRLTR
ncbi:hypothetical protein CTAYLR_006836 [Chrysophaeum taylorii]|uniref:PsbP C-terminal domain-containing protein n=1 Tax=Chrysophaeum taylorii TaxID=2483200 RepID=A0AAD7UC99_9STRA|nr:hypothetical protein CTAYLR_006836 [Chrysophaeum taylorii]